MPTLRYIDMPSGSKLGVQMAPFKVSKELYKSVLSEVKNINISLSNREEIAKNLICVLFSSDLLENSVKECFKSCVYDSGKGLLKIDDHTFEDDKLREDYPIVCLEVAVENLMPFMKSLSALSKQFLEKIPENPA